MLLVGSLPVHLQGFCGWLIYIYIYIYIYRERERALGRR